MPDILVRNIEEVIAERIKAIAREREWSINDVIVHLLRQSLGLADDDIFRREMHDIAVIGGTWDSRETKAFRSAVEAFEQIEGQPLFESIPNPDANPDEKKPDDQAPK
ncbi:MAG TPA: hypothetical protein VFI49_02570 [Rudaea sp.]|nr:hypothetical protein [Rudaea sp.]